MTAAQPAYVWQKTHQAVRILAGSPKNLRERLKDAWWYELHALTGNPIPWDYIREKFEKIYSELAPEISEGEPQMQEEGLRKISGEILDLYDDVCRRHVSRHDAGAAE